MSNFITTCEVCRDLDLTEPALRHILRRPDAPRPAMHPSARVFLWTADDVDALRAFIGANVYANQEQEVRHVAR